MLVPHITSVVVGPHYMLKVHFSDGTSGEIDLSDELSGEVFEPLRDQEYFAQGRLNQELNTVCWPNGADLAPEYLYQRCQELVKAA